MSQFLGDDYDDDEQKLFEAISFYQRAKGRSLLEGEKQYNDSHTTPQAVQEFWACRQVSKENKRWRGRRLRN